MGVIEFIVDGIGKVIGVMWKWFFEIGVIKVKLVIIVVGGFVMNLDMVVKYILKLVEKLFVLGNIYDDGLGIWLGVLVGGVI